MLTKVFLGFALLAAAAAWGDWAPGLRVRFGIGLSGYFMSMPRTIAEAKTNRWVQVTRPDGHLPTLVMYCPEDYIFCVLFDDTENIAGVHVSIPQDKFSDSLLDWETQGFTSWTPTDSATTYWTTQQYFVDEEYLAISLEDRLAAYDTSKTIQNGKLWLTGFNKDLLELSTVEDEIEDAGFTEQACIPLMGRHYYYNMTTTSECSSGKLYPWFPLAASGDLIGMGLLMPGLLPESELTTDYFERPDQAAVEMIVPTGSDCLYNLATTPGLVTMHIYYINNPFLLTCIFQ